MFSPISQIIADIKIGKPVIVFDSESRENEGDIVIAGVHAQPEIINFMSGFGRGLICAALDFSVAERLQLMLLPTNSTDPFKTAWLMPVDAVGTTTGISAFDRALTIQTLANPTKTASDFIWPGHVPTLRARAGGVVERPGHTESAIDLVTLAELTPVAAICEIMLDSGKMARLEDLQKFSEKYGLKLCRISDIQEYIKTKK